MKKRLIISSVLCLLVLAGCGAKPAAQDNAGGVAFSGSIADLVKAGKSVKCVLIKPTDSMASGTTYVSGTKARTDFELKASEGQPNTKSHFITDGTWMYSWNEGNLDQAIKFNLADLQKPEFKQQEGDKADNYDASMDYSCTNWQADSSFFTPPAGINFTDYSALLNQLQNQFKAPSTGGNTLLCAQCDQVQGAEAKAQCKASLGCK